MGGGEWGKRGAFVPRRAPQAGEMFARYQRLSAFDSGLSNASLRIPNRPMPHYSLDATCVCQHACNKFPLLRFFELHPVLPVVFGARVRYT